MINTSFCIITYTDSYYLKYLLYDIIYVAAISQLCTKYNTIIQYYMIRCNKMKIIILYNDICISYL